MYALGYCIEKHRCHSCGAHGPGKTLAAQVIPREVTEEFVKLRQLPGISISNQLLKQLVYVLHSWNLSKLPTYMFLPARKQFGHRRVALQKLDAQDYRARSRGGQ